MGRQFFVLIALIATLGALDISITACSRFNSSGSNEINNTLALPACPQVNAQGMCQKCGTQMVAAWSIPTTNIYGNPLPVPLSGFNVYYGPAAATFNANQVNIPSPTTATTTLNDLTPGNYYVAVTAYAVANNQNYESAPSNIRGVELMACSSVVIEVETGKLTYNYMPPKIVQMAP